MSVGGEWICSHLVSVLELHRDHFLQRLQHFDAQLLLLLLDQPLRVLDQPEHKQDDVMG